MDIKSTLLDELKAVLGNKSGTCQPSKIKQLVTKNKNEAKTEKCTKPSKKNSLTLPPIAPMPPNSYIEQETNDEESNFNILFKQKIIDYKKLLPSTHRKNNLREKYECILSSDIPFLSGIFRQIRNYFYNQHPKYSEKINIWRNLC